MPPRNETLPLLLISLLSGCGTIGIPSEHLRKEPVIVNPNRSFLFQDQYVYENVGQEALEKRLVELAATSAIEEGWVYNPRTRSLRETGMYETENETKNINPYWYLDFTQANDIIFHYHLHPANSFECYPDNDMTKTEITLKVNTTNAVMAIPSTQDLRAFLQFQESYNSEKVKVFCNIADYEGILTFRFNPLGDVEDSIEKYNSLWRSYVSLKIGFDELAEKAKKIGISMEYKQMFDITFQEKDITFHQNKNAPTFSIAFPPP